MATTRCPRYRTGAQYEGDSAAQYTDLSGVQYAADGPASTLDAMCREAGPHGAVWADALGPWSVQCGGVRGGSEVH